MEAGRLDPKITNVRTSGMYVGAMPSNSNNPFWFITGKTEMNVGSHDHPTYKMWSIYCIQADRYDML